MVSNDYPSDLMCSTALIRTLSLAVAIIYGTLYLFFTA